jgi:hypothetical protein
MIEIDGLNAGFHDDGAGVLVIFDDGSSPPAEIEIRDGHDFSVFVAPWIGTDEGISVPQTLSFTAGGSDRTASLALFVGDARADQTDRITVDVPGAPLITIDNSLVRIDGPQWDTVVIDVPIPAGASQMTVHVRSFDFGGGVTPDSINWLCAALSVPTEPPPPGGEGCTPGYWKNHLEDWPPTGLDPGDDFDATFGVDLFTPDITLEQAVNAKGGGVNKLARHGTAALLSALHPAVDYPFSDAEVIDFVQAGDAGPLVAANELGCDIP